MSTWYINPSGNDSTGDGSSGNPWKTISKAHTSATSGDTVICQAGTYPWVAQNFTKNLTIEGETAPSGGVWTTIFDASAVNDAGWVPNGVTCDITLRNIDFRNNKFTTTYYAGIFGPSTHVYCFNPLTVDHCRFYNIGTHTQYGAGCLFSFGLAAVSNTVDWSFTQNLFEKIYNAQVGTEKSAVFGYRVGDTGVGTISFVGNTFYLPDTGATAPDSLWFLDHSPSAALSFVMKNNIVYSGAALLFYNQYSYPTVSNTYNDYYNITSPPTAGTGVITSDPLFVDAANGNFHLRTTSPCIDTGGLI